MSKDEKQSRVGALCPIGNLDGQAHIETNHIPNLMGVDSLCGVAMTEVHVGRTNLCGVHSHTTSHNYI